MGLLERYSDRSEKHGAGAVELIGHKRRTTHQDSETADSPQVLGQR